MNCVRLASERCGHTSNQAKPGSRPPFCWESREGLPFEETMPFFLTGTVHLLVVSGLNVAILATGLYALVWIGWLPRRTALALTMITVVVYALVAGADPPVLRATVLVVIVCLGIWTGRRARPSTHWRQRPSWR